MSTTTITHSDPEILDRERDEASFQTHRRRTRGAIATGTVAQTLERTGTRTLRDQAEAAGYLQTSSAASQTFTVTTNTGGRQGVKFLSIFS